MKNYNPIGLIVLLFTFTLSIFIFFCESQAENLPPIYLLLLGSEDGVSDTIGPAGGYLEIQDAKDNLYRLIIPQGALTKQKLITIKPTAAGGFASLLGPLSGSLALFPQGLTFSTPAKLEIVLSKNTIIPPIPAIYLEEETGKPGILLEVVQSGQTLTASLEHFSTVTPVGPNALDLQQFIDISMQQTSQWETNCAATSQMAEKRKFYKDTVELEYFILRILQLWGLGGDFGFEPRTGTEDYCGGLFDPEITFILIFNLGTYWPPGMGHVEMEVNEQRQLDYKIACVNGFCQGDVIWFIPGIPQPPIASVTQGGVVTGLRDGMGELQVFSKDFKDVLESIILGLINLKVGRGDCVYYSDQSTTLKDYYQECGEIGTENFERRTHLFGPGKDRITIVHTGNFTAWLNHDPFLTSSLSCYDNPGIDWYVNDDFHAADPPPHRIRFDPGFIQQLGYYPTSLTIDNTYTICWPDADETSCGAYACPPSSFITPTNAFPGDCHQWWDHNDDQGVWQECTY